MSKVERFEDLVAWQKARALTADVYRLTQQGALRHDFGLVNQIQRAAVSIMANIAEGFERNRLSEFQHYLAIAKASCAELRSELYVALDAGYIHQETFSTLMAQSEEVARVIGGLRLSIERRRAPQTDDARPGSRP